MKTLIRTLGSVALLSLLPVTPGTLKAQTSEETTTVKTTSSAGVISEFGPRTIVIRREDSPEPLFALLDLVFGRWFAEPLRGERCRISMLASEAVPRRGIDDDLE